jgi:HAD superfamily hydrolase (TIGR01509 family)
MAVELLIFDMDGTLVELKDVHYEALNKAIGEVDEKYIITREEHETSFDGLPTKKKLEMLTQMKGLPETSYEQIWKRKQDLTIEVINSSLEPDQEVIETLAKLKKDGYTIIVCSNSISSTIAAALKKAGLSDYVDAFLSNEDVRKPKPNPEMFWKAIITHKYSVDTVHKVMIFEDSKYGLEAAYATKAYVYEVVDTRDIRYEPIKFKLDYIKDSEGFYR